MPAKKLTEKQQRLSFWLRVDMPDLFACWEWKSHRSATNYGVLRIGSENWRAHRLAWVYSVGSIPDGDCVLHKCDNRACVNPAHLFLGDHSLNMADCSSKGRVCHGEDHPNSKLVDSDIEKIVKLVTSGAKRIDVANQFGVSKSRIGDIVTGKSWVRVNPNTHASRLTMEAQEYD